MTNPIIAFRNVSKVFEDSGTQVLKDINFELEEGKFYTLLGASGSGKSTILNIIAGLLDATSGDVLLDGKRINDIPINKRDVHTVFQSYALFPHMNVFDNVAFALKLKKVPKKEIEERVEEALKMVQLNGYQKRSIQKLSGGQRSKIILGKLLLQNPDVLVLDEPTNYLDVSHIDWLVDYLNNFEGAFIVVSHDYDFLGRITNCIIDIDFGTITRYTGTLKQAMRQKAANRETYLKAYANQQRKIAKTEAYIRKNKAGTRAKSAKSREKQLARMDVLTPPKNNRRAKFEFPYVATASNLLLQTQDLVIGYDQALVKSAFNFSVGGDEKVAITGFNGIGKTTLLKTLLGQLKPIYGSYDLSVTAKLAYFKQDLTWPNNNMTPLQYLQEEFERKKPKELRQALARMGLTAQQAMSPLKELSGGEQEKVKLAKMQFEPANLLFLDEPTNHLDNDTKDALRKAIINFSGGVIIVSHERDFFRGDWIDKTIDIETMN